MHRSRNRIDGGLSGLGLFSPGDVAGNANTHLLGLEPLGRPHDVDDMALLVNVAVFVVSRGLPCGNLSGKLAGGFPVIGMYQLKRGAAYQFFGRIAENPFAGCANG